MTPDFMQDVRVLLSLVPLTGDDPQLAAKAGLCLSVRQALEMFEQGLNRTPETPPEG